MKEIDVGELRDDATTILHAVRDGAAEYVITVDGEPVAVIRPFTAADAQAQRAADAAAFMAELAHIRTVLATATPPGAMTGLDHLEAMREERMASLLHGA